MRWNDVTTTIISSGVRGRRGLDAVDRTGRVGDCVGVAVVGEDVGASVGNDVGASVGDNVGDAVGALLGDCEGAVVGAFVGDIVAFVGDSVGESVVATVSLRSVSFSSQYPYSSAEQLGVL